MDIDGWLGRIGLAQYAEMFRANDIDGELLGRLTNDDLKDIGVASFGHRKKLLEAIAELGGAPAATHAPRPVVQAPVPATVAPPPTSVSVEAGGERRHLTVMFCDLVGSTGISAKLDAEEWRDLVGAYIDAASAAVVEMGGHVAKKLGDGLMSLFGYPVAHENDAERAVRAALAIQRALAGMNRNNAGSGKPVLAARIGLETGPAVVDATGEIYGDVANIAARVQALAEPGAVLVTARVQRQVAGLFVAEERGTHTLKGVPEPTALFRLVRASGGGRRSGQRNLTPLVGRDDEITMLMRRWERARQGDGQLVMIVGEPGLGKSRLIEEFHARLADTPHTWVEWSCSQLLQNTPLHPIAEWGRQRFGGADVSPERRLTELESSLAQVKLDSAENLPLLAPLLDIPLLKERVPALVAEELRRRQLAALTNWVMAGAKVQALVLAFEDLHWADPTTLDVLRGIAERGALAPLFIVATTRPEFHQPWSMRSHHSTISLAPLDRGQVQEMVAELSARHALPHNVVEDVAARTGGVPLFVEEVTRLLLERGEGGGGIEAIPATLQQSLMARLDRLGPAREVAQIGSVIGRGFTYALIRDVAGIENAALQAALEKLAEADIVLVQGLPPESDCRTQPKARPHRLSSSGKTLVQLGARSAWRACDGRDGASRGARRTYRARKQVVGPAHPRSARRARSRRTRRGRRLEPDRCSARARGRDGRTLDRRPLASHSRRHPAEGPSRRPRARRASLPRRHRRCARAGCAQLLPASGAEAGETVPIDRPPRRRPRRACAGARRLLINSGVTGDRGSPSAARYTGERRSGQGCAREATGPLTTDFETASKAAKRLSHSGLKSSTNR